MEKNWRMMEMEKKTMFLRTATGLVRPWSTWDGYIYNLFAVNPFIIYGATFVNGFGLSPGANMWLALLIVAVTSTFLSYNEAALISTMPRSGGDYVFQSRIVGGKIGYVLTWGLMLVNQPAIFGMLAGWWCATMVLAPFFTIYGALLNSPAMSSSGVWMTTQIGIFTMAVIAAVWSTIINLVGMAWYRRFQKAFFAAAVVSLAIVLVMIPIVGVSDFPAAFSGFATSVFGKDPGAYQLLLKKAYELGFTATAAPPSEAFIVSIPFAIGSMAIAWSAFNAGEIKGAASLRGQVYQVVLASITAAILSFVLYYAIVFTAGDEWYRAASWMYWTHGADYSQIAGPVAPYFGLILGILFYKNAIGLLAVFIAFQAWFWMWYPNIQVAVSRYMLALSFDRVFPASLGAVHPRWRTPHVAILVVFVLALLWSWVFSFPEYFRLAALVSLVGIIGYAGSGLAGALLPWRRKDLFQSSPASKHGPLIILSGLVWVIYSIICAVLYLGDARFFVYDPTAVGMFVATFLSAIVVYFAFSAYRKRQGIDVSRAYREIPVE